MFFKKKKLANSGQQDPKDGYELDIQLGGYYTSKGDDGFGVSRLLNFNEYDYHIQLFREKFDHPPTFDEVKELKPFILHVPIAVSGILEGGGLKLIGHKRLDEQSLMGYEEWLRAMDADEASIKEKTKNLIENSDKPPTKVKLIKKAHGVDILPLEQDPIST